MTSKKLSEWIEEHVKTLRHHLDDDDDVSRELYTYYMAGALIAYLDKEWEERQTLNTRSVVLAEEARLMSVLKKYQEDFICEPTGTPKPPVL